MLNRLSILSELFASFWTGKRWWMIPIILVFIVFGFVIIFVGSSPLAPIVYPLF